MRTGSKERGDVLMEYVLLMTLIIAPIVCGSKMIFDAGGANGSTASVSIALEKDDDFGIVGNNFVNMFRRTFSGLALPVP
jgi:hypothetical protein